MAKGKYSRSHREEDADMLRRFSRALQEDETVVLKEPTPNPLDLHDEKKKPEEKRDMPACDFENLADLDSISQLSFPELSALDTESEDSGFHTRFEPIPSHYEQEKEEKSSQSAPGGAPSRKKIRVNVSGILKGLSILLLLSALVFLGAGGYLLYSHFSDPYDHEILNGVCVAGVNLGSLKKGEAEDAVAAAAEGIFGRTAMEVHLPGETLILSPAEAKVSLRVSAAVKEAYEYGRSGSKQEKEQAYRDSLTGTHEIDLLPYLSADEDYIEKQLKAYAAANNSGFTPSSYALEGDQPPLDFENFNEKNTPQTLLLILGNPGFHLDTEKALQEIMAAYSRLDFSPSLELEAGEKEPETLDLNRIFEEYHIGPVNSSMDRKTYEIISGSYGYTFDLQQARRMLLQARYGETVRIPMKYVKPEIMDDGVYFQDVLSRVETPHGDNKHRNKNLTLACEAIDGLILNPGDEFSYNATLGQRTADKGYEPAPAYSGDQLVNSLGGGICQVSSTLYLSCLLADLEITDRINHGFLASYIDPGMDATVSWEKPDFKFRNNTSCPIQIRAENKEDKVIIRILGTDDKDYYVKMSYEMSDILPNVVYEEHDADSGYYDGQVLNNGTIGHYVKTYRCKYSKKTNVLISREVEAKSSYMTRNKVIAVVKPAPTEAPPATQPPETQPPETKPHKPHKPTAPPPTEAPPSEPPATQAPEADS